MKPLDPVPFSSSSGDLRSSLAALSPHLQPKTPIYLLLRKDSSSNSGNELIAITYVPSTAPVRSKTLFASTRASLVRDLGLEKFADTLFVTDPEEVLDSSQWDERLVGKSGDAEVDIAILSLEERELQSVKRAEEEERHGTAGRDLMGGGGSGRQWGTSGAGGTSSSGVKMKVTDDAKAAFAAVSKDAMTGEGGYLVQFGIDLPTETLELLNSATGVSPGQVPGKIPSDRPTYSFYHYPGTETIIFMYTCPGTSKVKERMVYASSRNGVIEVAKGEGVVVSKRLEAGDPEDITEQRLRDEAGVSSTGGDTAAASSRQGFARPKRPGKR